MKRRIEPSGLKHAPERWTADYRIVPFVTRPGAPILARASFVIEAGRPGGVPA